MLQLFTFCEETKRLDLVKHKLPPVRGVCLKHVAPGIVGDGAYCSAAQPLDCLQDFSNSILIYFHTIMLSDGIFGCSILRK